MGHRVLRSLLAIVFSALMSGGGSQIRISLRASTVQEIAILLYQSHEYPLFPVLFLLLFLLFLSFSVFGFSSYFYLSYFYLYLSYFSYYLYPFFFHFFIPYFTKSESTGGSKPSLSFSFFLLKIGCSGGLISSELLCATEAGPNLIHFGVGPMVRIMQFRRSRHE
jgi:hypothetical protein